MNGMSCFINWMINNPEPAEYRTHQIEILLSGKGPLPTVRVEVSNYRHCTTLQQDVNASEWSNPLLQMKI